jgi:ferredoxin
MFSVQLSGQEWHFSAQAERTLLESAALCDIILPSSCRNGTCRTCMCRMTQGQIRYQIDWPGLTAEEKQEGMILPCVAYPLSHLILENPTAQRR